MEPEKQEARYAAGVSRVYQDERIAISWSATLCIHAANCIRHLPAVFDPEARPWVRIENGNADDLAAAVASCPTGALSYERRDGGPQEEPPDPAIIEPRRNGPLYVRGRLRIVEEEGGLLRETTRAALCRCGASENKPFCDLSHRRIGFRT